MTPTTAKPMAQTYFEDVEVGQLLPSLLIAVDPVQMFYFSAATMNGHLIHYDRKWATEVEGYADIVVQGPLQAALLARAVTDWVGDRGRLLNYSVQNRASAFVGEEMCFTGSVTATREQDGKGLVELAIRGQKADGSLLMPGTAVVELPRRSSDAAAAVGA